MNLKLKHGSENELAKMKINPKSLITEIKTKNSLKLSPNKHKTKPNYKNSKAKNKSAIRNPNRNKL